MANDLARLIRRQSATRPAQLANMAMAPVDPAILDPDVAFRLGKRPSPRAAWISERELLDAMMTFALVFTGAMVFLL